MPHFDLVWGHIPDHQVLGKSERAAIRFSQFVLDLWCCLGIIKEVVEDCHSIHNPLSVQELGMLLGTLNMFVLLVLVVAF